MLSLIIPWFDRHELKEALPSIIRSASNVGGDVTVINLGGNKDLLNEQLSCYKHKVKVIHIQKRNGFNKPVAHNYGAQHTKHPYMFFCDCDIILLEDTLEKLFNKVKAQKDVFGTLARIKETQLNARGAGNVVMFGYELKLRILDGTQVRIVDNEEDAADGTRQAPGLLLVKRSDFEKVNGYNSSLDGWGWEDQDMICRLTLHAKLTRITEGDALHISHDEASRIRGYPNYGDRWQSRDCMFRKALKNYNENNFLGTYTEDCARYQVNVEEEVWA